MTLYEMVSLEIPYHNINVLDVSSAILQGQLPDFECIDQQYEILKPLLLQCLQSNPNQRPTAGQLISILSSIGQ